MIRQTTVDGVPTLLAPSAGGLHAGLIFRVGRADETLAGGGITHLLEHLALHGVGPADYHFNGATGPVTTEFHLTGEPAEIVRFLAHVCRALHAPPVDRLQTEKAILRTEWSSRGSSVLDRMALWRYGARGYGLTSYPEWGLTRIDAEDLRRWAATFFTRDNAVLWIAGDDVPAGLTLPLPPGARRPVPAPTSALPTTPAFFTGSDKAVGYDAIVNQTPAASVFAAVLERELFRALRTEGGLSYTAATSNDPRGDGYTTITAWADALPEQLDAVVGGLVDVLATLRVGRFDADDIAAIKARFTSAATRPDAEAASVAGQARELLTGRPVRDVAERVAALRDVTHGDLHQVAAEATASALLMVPPGRRADWAGFAAAPTASTHAVEGRSVTSRAKPEIRLVLGPDGVSLRDPDSVDTVRFAECVAMLAWPDGGRQLIGADAIGVRIEPTLFPLSPAELHALDAAVLPENRVDLPARDPADIPQPSAATSASGPPERSRGVVLASLIFLSVLVFGLAVVAALDTLGLALQGGRAEDWLAVAFLWALVGASAVGLWRVARRYRRQWRNT